jgi:hypothetical protein
MKYFIELVFEDGKLRSKENPKMVFFANQKEYLHFESFSTKVCCYYDFDYAIDALVTFLELL